MSEERSESTGETYGMRRVSRTLGVPRSSFYETKLRKRSGKHKNKRRGPVPAVSDEELLALIKEDLAASPFVGEGHRKVWARLKFGKGIRVSRKRVLRLMRENNLLSPYRRPQMPGNEHDGQIVTSEPNVMWGTDGAKVFTRCEGWGWIFVNVEHWNAEVMGWHVCKKGDRFAACEPVAMGVLAEYGSVERGAARGLSLRMDHGTQYLSDHFQKQIEAWGIAPSFAFLEQPQTNGVAERFLRTLQEQAIYGRVFDTIEEVRQAVAEFVERYNDEWLIEKNGYLSPRRAREAYYEREMEAAA
jgi:transposase InsO family protein